MNVDDSIWVPMHDDVVVPEYETKWSAGMDIRSATVEDIFMNPGDIAIIETGLKVKLMEGEEVQIRPRSGLAFKSGVTVLNSPGTIDADYKHEVKVCLVNHGKATVRIAKGDRICQAVFSHVLRAPGVRVKDVTREGGFGSTGSN